MKEPYTDQFKEILDNSQRIAGFTGAGISTESGISDYRSKGGLWDRFQPVYYQEFLSDPEKRKLYWERKIEMWPSIREGEPNNGHLFYKRLYDEGKLIGLITQNIDGLHEKSGLPKDLIVNLHGTNLDTRCLSCNTVYPSEGIFRDLNLQKLEEEGPPACDKCGGLLKPDTISFGQNLRSDTLHRAEEISLQCDCMICFGSTLVVHPAAGYPEKAKRRGAKLIIVTLSETPLDDYADLLIHEKIGDVVDALGSAQT